jgi:hypothetical protein
MKLDAKGFNEHGVLMCECGNKRVHAWEPGEWCGDHVLPAAAAEVRDCERCGGSGELIRWLVGGEEDPRPCPDCNGTGKQSPAEPQGDVVDLEDQLQRCDNCERFTAEDDLKTIWCREPESGEQVDARICLVCRLEADRDKSWASIHLEVKERLEGLLVDAEMRREETRGEPWKAVAVERASVLGEVIRLVAALAPVSSEPDWVCAKCGERRPVYEGRGLSHSHEGIPYKAIRQFASSEPEEGK